MNVTEILPSKPDEADIAVTYFDELSPTATDFPCYQHVALGGSFDHMHNGHRKLLYLAVCCSLKELTVGVTGDSMLTAKSQAHLIDPYAVRAKKVEDFVKGLNPRIKLNIVVSKVVCDLVEFQDVPLACSR
jgi:hypothetical protein